MYCMISTKIQNCKVSFIKLNSNLSNTHFKICEMYPVAINNRVKLACASYLICTSKTDTLTFVYKDYRISFYLNHY